MPVTRAISLSPLPVSLRAAAAWKSLFARLLMSEPTFARHEDGPTARGRLESEAGGSSSTARVPVSKTGGSRFESWLPRTPDGRRRLPPLLPRRPRLRLRGRRDLEVAPAGLSTPAGAAGGRRRGPRRHVAGALGHSPRGHRGGRRPRHAARSGRGSQAGRAWLAVAFRHAHRGNDRWLRRRR